MLQQKSVIVSHIFHICQFLKFTKLPVQPFSTTMQVAAHFDKLLSFITAETVALLVPHVQIWRNTFNRSSAGWCRVQHLHQLTKFNCNSC